MRFLLVALIAAFAVAASATLTELEYDNLFRKFALEHGKFYKTEAERNYRKSVFRKNLDYVMQENNSGRNTYTLAMNQFGDLTNEEYRKYLRPLSRTFAAPSVHEFHGEALPDSVNWVTAGKVSRVKDQGQCGSCYAFSAVGAVEGAWAIAKKDLVNLSEQNVVDCSKTNDGCDGGLMDLVFEDIINWGGIDTEASYPYKAVQSKCKFSKANIGATISSYVNVTANDNKAMMSAVAQQPVAVAISASSMSFQFYSSGVYSDSRCPNDFGDLDHGVLAVGYGTENGKDYYLVKNSWGPSWGARGYIKMLRGDKVNQCGILDYANYPVV